MDKNDSKVGQRGRCPVLAQCRAWALETREPHGIWGGLTPHQRHTLLRDTG